MVHLAMSRYQGVRSSERFLHLSLVLAGLSSGGPVSFSVAQYDYYKIGTGAEGGAVGAGHNRVTRSAGVRPTAQCSRLRIGQQGSREENGLYVQHCDNASRMF